MASLMRKLLYLGWFLLVFILFLYSYTQVDLNLTLTQLSFWQAIQKAFQDIGWYKRPLSTGIYLMILFLFFTFYILLWRLVKQKKISEKNLWFLIGVAFFVLLFSYNAFSYDLFNYLFDARIFTVHGDNPYFRKALDYPDDPWTHFMRWTHRTYPYGPVWLMATIPLSYLGRQFFLPTLFLFKGLMAASYLGTVYFIGEILKRIDPKRKLLGMAFFALNPLVIIESLVSAHNDTVMMFLAVGAFYYLMMRRYFWALMFISLSIGVKFGTILLLPAFIFGFLGNSGILRVRKGYWDKVFWLGFLGMAVAILLATWRTELQPWYLLYIMPLGALLVNNKMMRVVSLTLSAGLLLHYAPFLYFGDWDEPVPAIKLALTFGSLVLGILGYLGIKKIGEVRV